jgi:hypothetical protein
MKCKTEICVDDFVGFEHRHGIAAEDGVVMLIVVNPVDNVTTYEVAKDADLWVYYTLKSAIDRYNDELFGVGYND